MIPLQMENKRDELRSVLNELTNADQRLMLGNISLVHLADSKEELDNDTEHIRSFGSSHECKFETLFPSTRQLSGLYTVLPYFDNYLMNQRILLSLSAGAFIPFRSQEIMKKGGIWYGQNKITNNPIICNKTALKNCNALTFGVPGSGKSFLTKEEIEFLILGTNDEIIICDPEGEYTPIVEAFGGVVISITAKGKDHINATDMFHGYGNDGNSIADKSQFIMSLFEELDTRHEGISANDRSIIDRCVHIVYEKAFEENKTPVLMDLYNILCEQPEKEAKDLATRIEICAGGSFDTFGYPTNVDINNRIVSFNLRNLQKQQKPIGLLVVTDAIINRVNENWRNHKKTHVFIDEIHVIFEHKESETFFSSAWRQFRKRDAYPTGITQNVSFLLTSDEGRDIVSNTEFIVMLSQAEPDQVRIAELLKIPAEQMQHVNNAPAGTGLIKFGPTIIPFVNQIPKGPLYSLNTTNPNDEESSFRRS